MRDPADLSATEARAAIATGRLSPHTLLEACLERIAARESQLRAFAWLDPALARRAVTAARPGPLCGLPLGVKDVLDTADQPTQYGSPIWAGHRPRADAAVVAAARAAGAVVIGKTVTTEFATRHPGPTTNPHHPAHTPGGSSSGSAAGVAAGFFPLALGTQTAGSIIRPAAFCGIVGFKPSFGQLHRGGMKVMSESLDTIGIMARRVEDCALAFAALRGEEIGRMAIKLPRPPRLAVVMGPPGVTPEPAMQALLEESIEVLRRAGAELRPLMLPPLFATAHAAHPLVMYREAAAALAWEWQTARPLLSATLRQQLSWALAVPVAQLEEGRAAFAAARAAFPAVIEGFDAVLTPAAPGEAPYGLRSTGDPAFNALWTLLHGPCLSLPAQALAAGRGPRGLPLGLQLVGRMGEDAPLLACAAWIEAVLS